MVNRQSRALRAFTGKQTAGICRRTVEIKAISVRQPWASMIAQGDKTIETRTWYTKYRGPLLIVSSKKPVYHDLPLGQALCAVELVDCRPMTIEDEDAARCKMYEGAFAWVLSETKALEPFDVKGKLGIYEVEIPTTVDKSAENALKVNSIDEKPRSVAAGAR